jgi:hypothetical protein
VAGKALFEDANAWTASCEIFTNILRDPNLNNAYLIIDVLNEYETDLPKWLDFIVQQSPVSSRVKWSSLAATGLTSRKGKRGRGLR